MLLRFPQVRHADAASLGISGSILNTVIPRSCLQPVVEERFSRFSIFDMRDVLSIYRGCASVADGEILLAKL